MSNHTAILNRLAIAAAATGCTPAEVAHVRGFADIELDYHTPAVAAARTATRLEQRRIGAGPATAATQAFGNELHIALLNAI